MLTYDLGSDGFAVANDENGKMNKIVHCAWFHSVVWVLFTPIERCFTN